MMGTDEGGQAVEHHDRALDVDPALLGHEAGVRISRQASLVVVQPALQHLGPLAQTGSAHFEIAPPPDQHGGAGVERGARRSSLVRSIGLGPFTRFQRRHDLLELGDAGALGRQQRLQFLDPQVERCQLGVSLATATLGPSQGCDPGTELGLVLPPTLGRRLHGTRRPRPVVGRPGDGSGGRIEPGGGGTGLRNGVVEGRGRDTARSRGPQPPAPLVESVTIGGDDHGIGGRTGQGDGGIDVTDPNGVGQQGVEQPSDAGVGGDHMRADRVTGCHSRQRSLDGETERHDGARGVGCPQGAECASGCLRIGDDDRGQRFAERGLDRDLPPLVDPNELEQRAEHTLETGQALGTGASAGGVERELQRLDPSSKPGRGLRRPLTLVLSRLGRRGGGVERSLGRLALDRQIGLGRFRRSHGGALVLDLGRGRRQHASQFVAALPSPQQVALRPLDRGPHRPQLAADLSQRATGPGVSGGVDRFDGGQRVGPLHLERRFVLLQPVELGFEPEHIGPNGCQFVPRAGRVGLERGDDSGIEQLAAVAFERSTTFGDHRRQPPRPFTELLDLAQPVGDVLGPPSGQLGADADHLGVQQGQFGLERRLGGGRVELGGRDRDELRAQSGDLSPGDVDPQPRQLADQITVPASGFGLTLQRPELAADLTEQVLHPQQVGLGAVEPTLGLLLALAKLEDARCFLDDATAILRASVQNGIDLTLADDDMLLTPDPGIREQVLHVEQAARHAVDGVLALTRAEQGAAHCDFGEVDVEESGRVVDGEGDFGSAQGRPGGGAGEDDVVHLLAAHRAGCLRAEDPRNGIHHVRLARPVGADHDRDAGLELHRRRLGERLETLEGEGLQEHGDPTLSPRTQRDAEHRVTTVARSPATVPGHERGADLDEDGAQLGRFDDVEVVSPWRELSREPADRTARDHDLDRVLPRGARGRSVIHVDAGPERASDVANRPPGHPDPCLHLPSLGLDLVDDRPPRLGQVEACGAHDRIVEHFDRPDSPHPKGALTAVGVGHQVPGDALLDHAERVHHARRRVAFSVSVLESDLTSVNDRLSQFVQMGRGVDRGTAPAGRVEDGGRGGGFGVGPEGLRQGLHQLAECLLGLGGGRRSGTGDQEQHRRLGRRQAAEIGAGATEELPSAVATRTRIDREPGHRQRLEVAPGSLDRDLQLLGQLGGGDAAPRLQHQQGGHESICSHDSTLLLKAGQ